MGLNRILAALLPRDSREHVMGDLSQRGYRVGDILSVLPAAWFSHLGRYLSREWLGPVPSLAGAARNGDVDALLRRAAQMRRGTRWGFALWLWAILVSPAHQLLHLNGFWQFLPGFLCGSAIFLFWLRREGIERRGSPLQQYRRSFAQGRWAAFGPVSVFLLSVRVPHNEPWSQTMEIAGLSVALGTCILRLLRLERENRALP